MAFRCCLTRVNTNPVTQETTNAPDDVFLGAEARFPCAAMDPVCFRLGTWPGLLILQQTQTHYCIYTKWQFTSDQVFQKLVESSRFEPRGTNRSYPRNGSRCAPLIHTRTLEGKTFTAVAGGSKQPQVSVLS